MTRRTSYPKKGFAVEQFTTRENLWLMYSHLTAFLQDTPDYFEMVLEVQSLYRTGYQFKILHRDKIKPDEFNWEF